MNTRAKSEEIPAAYCCMILNNELFFLFCKFFMFKVRPQVVSPSEPATLSTSIQSYKTAHLLIRTTQIIPYFPEKKIQKT